MVEIPEGITDEDELKRWEARKKEDEDIRRIFRLTNPTVPGFSQIVEMEFYANPVPELELILRMDHRGLWGGGGTQYSLSFPLVLEEAFVRYYTERAMFTVGRFKYELGPVGLLMGNQIAGKEGLIVNTMYKYTWITGVYNRLLMSMYKEYPYVSTYLLDELTACRFSRKFGDKLVGLNIILNGFYDEKALSLDLVGKISGHTIKGELGLVYPAWVYRENVDDRVWPGGVVFVNLIENEKQLFSMRLGAFSKGFIAQYGKRGMSTMESGIKFHPNTAGIDLLYQHGLNNDLVLGLNLVYLDYLDKKELEKLNRVPLRVFEVKLQKYLSEVSDISFSTAYIEDKNFNYGKAVVSWQFNF
ncbi:hypothetical protein BBF96_01610 [Anoxybacter fermentans]|uniref:Uncharacterized protein n=1 Tax=Anoxybacter fermentans TaxID=1323375 RepID=A0A3S9SVA1_9FIRM|nr:hypothetical protein [Anoxybacter fermentans]AZR72205.1 hypothetical protein BBF96_01610 [Anoxybacter fermentans]